MLCSNQVGAVDNPVIVTTTVEALFLPKLLLVSTFLLSSLSLGTRWGGFFSDDATVATLPFLRNGNATPTARLALLVGGFILVCKLEDLVLGARGSVRSREGIIVDVVLEVPICFFAEAVEDQCNKIAALRLNCSCLVFVQVACFSQGKRSQWSMKFVKDNLGGSQGQPGGTI